MDADKLLKIIRLLTESEDCYATLSRGADGFVDRHCSNPVTHVGEDGVGRCEDHLSLFIDAGIEYVALPSDEDAV